MSDASDFDAYELYISIVRSPDLREEVLKLAGLLKKE
jgi:hypothetical protein